MINMIQQGLRLKKVLSMMLVRFEYRHPLILEDGSLIADSDYSPIFKLDICSNLMWINQEKYFITKNARS